jgi:hypothetical protein
VQNSPVLEFRVQDGDSGEWRKLALSIASDPRGYFQVEQRGVDVRGVHVARLLTSATLIDREDPSSQGGLYTVVLKVRCGLREECTCEECLSDILKGCFGCPCLCVVKL